MYIIKRLLDLYRYIFCENSLFCKFVEYQNNSSPQSISPYKSNSLEIGEYSDLKLKVLECGNL